MKSWFSLQRRKLGRILGIFNTVYCQTAAFQMVMLEKSIIKFVQSGRKQKSLNGPLDVCRDNIVNNMMISWVQSIGY